MSSRRGTGGPWRAGLVVCLGLAGCEPAEPFQAHFAVRGRWPDEPRIAYRIEGQGGALEPERFRAAIEAALAQWEATGCVRFHAAAPDDAAAVVFSWERAVHGACPAFGVDPGVAHAGPVGPGSFVHFDAERDWQPERALQQAALHEIGHVLGLDHSPDETAVMHPEPSPRRAQLAASDRAGIHALYGGAEPARGTLAVQGAGGRVVLASVAPPELTAWTLADTDGDGDDEILVWRTDAAGHGALWRYHFAPGPRLERAVGPLYGGVAPGPEPDGETLRGDLDGDGTPEEVTRS